MQSSQADSSSLTSFHEPRCCFVANCSFPYGPACQDCAFYFDIHKIKEGQLREAERMGNWAQDVSVKEDKRDGNDVTEAAEALQEEAPHPLDRMQKNGGDSLPEVDRALLALSLSMPLVHDLEKWLEEIFSQTLTAQLENKIFIGGAEDLNPENPCPICFKPLGDERDQHFLRCKYAHEEFERQEESRRR